MEDTHSKEALRIFGVVNEDTRRRAKIINYARDYSSGEIKVGLISGQYPTK